ncbi:hypothetical protein [Spirosoma linguale]|uniref:Outer membrane protein beta-barrel domain-containing protein n=1 Tax=Spirosoma linguale (strain ATCC 33905 / DSM 74 / LMG 10896 / Claus 1) TaxID=504472 RepID=D2QIN7_SPILD|nr:hypothetical protein Slin_3973 [Spirosoma linguale DSM 74]
MKHVFVLGVVLLLSISAKAQEFKPFKVNVSLGAAIPSGGGGVLFALEPKYGINDQIDIGLRIEGAAMARSVVANGNTTSGDVKFSGSYILTGNYMLSDNNFRPFVGIGAGLFGVGSTGFTVVGSGSNAQSTNGSISAGNVFGGMARVGFKAGHFVLGIEYNLIPNTKSVVYNSTGSSQIGTSVESKNSYVGVKLGFDIGGGRR